jgi:hypothetical protein
MREQPVLIELHTLPALPYLCLLSGASAIWLEAHEHYIKQTNRNRYYINTSHGRLRLTVPVQVPSGKIAIRDVRMETGLRWRNQHWRSIVSAYNKAPFFEHYADELQSILFRPEINFLWELNKILLSFCLTHLRLSTPVSETVAFVHQPDPAILDARNLFLDSKPTEAYPFYQSRPYYQVFGNTFVEGCSAIDLLFCSGPQAIQHVVLSRTPTNK